MERGQPPKTNLPLAFAFGLGIGISEVICHPLFNDGTLIEGLGVGAINGLIIFVIVMIATRMGFLRF